MVMYMHNVTMCTSVHVRACPCENHDIRANLHGRCTDVHGLARIFLSAPETPLSEKKIVIDISNKILGKFNRS